MVAEVARRKALAAVLEQGDGHRHRRRHDRPHDDLVPEADGHDHEGHDHDHEGHDHDHEGHDHEASDDAEVAADEATDEAPAKA